MSDHRPATIRLLAAGLWATLLNLTQIPCAGGQIGRLESTPNAPGLDSLWRARLAFLAGGTGIWITSNQEYRTEDNGEPPYYGMRYWMGLGGTSQHGCLWGQGPGSRTAVFWSFFTAWDPSKGQLLVHQASPSGVVGIGYESPVTGEAEQVFTAPDGTSWTVRHTSEEAAPDSLVTRSFRRSDHGDWAPGRTYRWIRQPDGAAAPC